MPQTTSVWIRATGLAVVSLALVVAATASAAAAGPRDLSYPPGFATYPLAPYTGVGVPVGEVWISTRVDNPPAAPVFTWTVDPPAGYPACHMFDQEPSQMFRASGTTTYGSRIHIRIGTANGCAPDGAEGGSDGFSGKISVSMVMGDLTCTVATTGPPMGACKQTGPPANGITTGSKSTTPSPTTSDPLSSLGNAAKIRAGIHLRVTRFDADVKRSFARDWAAVKKTLRTQIAQTASKTHLQAALEEKRLEAALARSEAARKQADKRLEHAKGLARYASVAFALGARSAALLGGVPEPAEPAVDALAVELKVEGRMMAVSSMDPPDPHFTSVAQPVRPAFPSLAAGSGVPPALTRAANGFAQHQATTIAVLDALRHSIERAQGAARAGALLAEARQLRAAAAYSRRAGRAVHSLPADLAALARALAAAGPTPSAAQLRAARQRVASHGLSADVLAALAKLGSSKAEVRALRKAVAHAPLDDASLKGLLDNPDVIAAAKQMSEDLANLAVSLGRLGNAAKALGTAKGSVP